MRLGTACLALLLSPTALAQELPPEAFYPLDVGNEWIYTFEFGGPRFLQHDRIVGTETVDGIAYTQRERCEVPVSEDGPGTPDCELQRIRFTADRDLVVRQLDGSELAEACAVGAPAGTVIDCDDVVGQGFELEVFRSGPTTVVVGQYVVEVEGTQSYDVTMGGFDPPPAGFALGLGRLAPLQFNIIARLEYARVGDQEYGVNPLDPAPWTFGPFAVGTVREYEVPGPDGPGQYLPMRRDTPRTLVLDGEVWFVERRQTLSLPDADGLQSRSESRQLVRFDTTSAQTVVRGWGGTVNPVYPCAFDAPQGISACEAGTVIRRDAATVRTAPADERTTSVLDFDTLGGTSSFVAGIGLVASQGDGASSGTSLVYADVGRLSTGDPLPFGAPLGELFPTEVDPTPAHRYYPLSVGDEWHYQFSTVQDPEGYRRYRITGTEVADGEIFFAREFSTARPGDSVPTWEVVWTTLVRYDSLSAQVVTPNGEVYSRCALDEPVQTNPYAEAPVFCARTIDDGQDDTYAVRFTDGGVAQQGGLVVPTPSFKLFYVRGLDATTLSGYAADVGLVYVPSSSATEYAALEYARVRQDDGSILELGAPLVVDADASPSGARLAVAARPNPTAGPLWLAFTSPTAAEATVEIVDALGRRVRFERRPLPAGETELGPYDTAAWAPGLYVVRVQAGDAVATARVVRR